MKPNLLSTLLCFLTLTVTPLATVQAQTTNPTPYYFTTVAGTSSIGSTDGTGIQSRFHSPSAIAVDPAGNLYVADGVNCTIRKVTATGTVTTIAGKAGETGSADGTGSDARFWYPYGITIDFAGNLYVADTSNSTIRKITPAGVVTTLAGTARTTGSTDGTGSAALFNYPHGITIDGAGNLYVADWANNLIRKISPTGTVTTLAGATGQAVSVDGAGTAARFTGPSGIVADPSGNLYVCEATMIRKITPTGDVTSLAGIPKAIGSGDAFGSADGTGTTARFNDPFGITRDTAGNLYVVDTFSCTIRKVTQAGVVTTFAGKAGAIGFSNGLGSAANFNSPEGITADQAGNLYVADTFNNNIRKIDPAGSVSTLAGLAPAQCVGSTDGLAEAARFYGAEGLAVGPAGELYVADVRNHTIRKITATGTVTTLAGLALESDYADGPGTSARFKFPRSTAVDSSGNVYVADSGNHVIRKITPTGVVSTIAGKAGQPGTTDGPVATALFDYPVGLAIDASGALYVSEQHEIRKISTDGQVSTIAHENSFVYGPPAVDAAGNVYTTVLDGYYGYFLMKLTPAGPVLLNSGFNHDDRPYWLTADKSGNLFYTSQGSRAIHKISSAGKHEIIGGFNLRSYHADGVGLDARFAAPSGIAVDSAGTLYISDCDTFDFNSATIRKGQLAGLPAIATQPLSQSVMTGSNVQLSVIANAIPAPAYQWHFNGSAFSGATGNTLSFASARSADAGDYSVVVTNSLGSVTSNKATLTISAAPTPPTTPSPTGGGGSVEAWFALALLALGVTRYRTIIFRAQ